MKKDKKYDAFIKNKDSIDKGERFFLYLCAHYKIGESKMESKLVIYNTLTRQKERFEPLHAPNVGMYVCGPPV